jgi:hypothetical protein
MALVTGCYFHLVSLYFQVKLVAGCFGNTEINSYLCSGRIVWLLLLYYFTVLTDCGNMSFQSLSIL